TTGYSSGPHLHFLVSRPILNDGKVTRLSVPVLFYANDPAIRFSAQTGDVLTANYRSPTLAQGQNARMDGTSTGTGRTSLDPPDQPTR
ncbi:MAG: hypothetical protein ACXWIS_23405, partial [Burkholderiales bacterium]